MPEIYATRTPKDTLVVTPGHEGVEYLYDRLSSGEEYVGFLFHDAGGAGPVMLALSLPALPHVVDGLRQLMENLEECRADYQARANNKGEK